MDFLNIVSEKTDQELLQMVYDFTAWSPEMLNAVEQELIRRHILPPDVKEKKEILSMQEHARLENGKEASTFGQAIGWLTVFGFAGIFIGYNYAYSKQKSKYTDEVYFKYDASSRQNGKYLFFTSLGLSTLALFWRVFIKSF